MNGEKRGGEERRVEEDRIYPENGNSTNREQLPGEPVISVHTHTNKHAGEQFVDTNIVKCFGGFVFARRLSFEAV